LPGMVPLHSIATSHESVAAEAAPRGGGRGNQVWVALEDAHRLVRVNLRKRSVVRRVRVWGRPHNIAVNGTGLVAATVWDHQRVVLVRRDWRRRVDLRGAPHDVKIGGGRIVVANQGAARLNILSLRGRKRGRVGLKANPHDVALTPGGDVAWASLEGSDDLVVVGLRHKRVKRYVSTGKSPHDLLFSPDGRLWVTDWNGALHVYSRKGRLLKSRALGDEAHHFGLHPRWPPGVDHRSRCTPDIRRVDAQLQGDQEDFDPWLTSSRCHHPRR
jgi:hypothetical protein